MKGEASGKVAIIDYGMGNLFSVKRACDHAGIDADVTSDPGLINAASGLILPGVGAFGDAMKSLGSLGLVAPVRDAIGSGRPVLAICLGMQLLLDESYEFGRHGGLGIVKGSVVKFPESGAAGKIKVPHIGWNRVMIRPGARAEQIFDNVVDGEYMYFVHSYYVAPDDPGVVMSMTDYSGIEFCSSLKVGNIYAFQFHPEKSGRAGLEIYRNFSRILS